VSHLSTILARADRFARFGVGDSRFRQAVINAREYLDTWDDWTASEGTAANRLLEKHADVLREETERRYPNGYPLKRR